MDTRSGNRNVDQLMVRERSNINPEIGFWEAWEIMSRNYEKMEGRNAQLEADLVASKSLARRQQTHIRACEAANEEQRQELSKCRTVIENQKKEIEKLESDNKRSKLDLDLWDINLQKRTKQFQMSLESVERDLVIYKQKYQDVLQTAKSQKEEIKQLELHDMRKKRVANISVQTEMAAAPETDTPNINISKKMWNNFPAQGTRMDSRKNKNTATSAKTTSSDLANNGCYQLRIPEAGKSASTGAAVLLLQQPKTSHKLPAVVTRTSTWQELRPKIFQNLTKSSTETSKAVSAEPMNLEPKLAKNFDNPKAGTSSSAPVGLPKPMNWCKSSSAPLRKRARLNL